MLVHRKIENMPFPRPCGASEIDAQNFMYRHLRSFVVCVCMKFYVPNAADSFLRIFHAQITFLNSAERHASENYISIIIITLCKLTEGKNEHERLDRGDKGRDNEKRG